MQITRFEVEVGVRGERGPKGKIILWFLFITQIQHGVEFLKSFFSSTYYLTKFESSILMIEPFWNPMSLNNQFQFSIYIFPILNYTHTTYVPLWHQHWSEMVAYISSKGSMQLLCQQELHTYIWCFGFQSKVTSSLLIAKSFFLVLWKCLTHLSFLYWVMMKFKYQKVIPNLHPIVNLFCHQQFKITRELELIQNKNTHCTFNQQYVIKCSKSLIIAPLDSWFHFSTLEHKKARL